jgi:hypothetical protein
LHWVLKQEAENERAYLTHQEAAVAALRIADHAYSEHVNPGKNGYNEFEDLGIKTKAELAAKINEVICAPTTQAIISHSDRVEYCDPKTSTFVPLNPRSINGGTAYRLASDGAKVKDCNTYMAIREVELTRNYKERPEIFPNGKPVIQPASCGDDKKEEVRENSTKTAAVPVTSTQSLADNMREISSKNSAGDIISNMGAAISKIWSNPEIGACPAPKLQMEKSSNKISDHVKEMANAAVYSDKLAVIAVNANEAIACNTPRTVDRQIYHA